MSSPLIRTATVIFQGPENFKYIGEIYVISDCSPDNLARVIQDAMKHDLRIKLINLEQTRGVDGTIIVGYKEALKNSADIIAKIDSDDQMDLDCLPAILEPLMTNRADYVKGNRFMYIQSKKEISAVRKIGISHCPFD